VPQLIVDGGLPPGRLPRVQRTFERVGAECTQADGASGKKRADQ
jgi:hypothetical protein